MKKLTVSLALTAVLALAVSGCAWHKATSVTANGSGGFSTNVVYSINTNNLNLQKTIIAAGTTEAVTLTLSATKNDPTIVQALKNAQVALDGILHGSNQLTREQVIAILKAQNNPTLSQQVDQLLQTISGYEQQWLVQFGASVAGQISVAYTEAVYSGLTVGLTGH
jgi:hypothetical protein